jgi:hypothetical protein
MSDIGKNELVTIPKHRFQKGNSGRPPGRPNKRTQFLTAIGQSNADEIVKKTVELARLGKQWACEAVLARLYPPLRSRLVRFTLPPLHTLADVTAAIAAVLQGVAGGQLTIEEGDMLANILERHGKAINDAEIERRLLALEADAERRLA